MKTLAVALVMIALPAAASQPVTPALLPKLIGSSELLIEKEFGKPVQDCRNGSTRYCWYSVDGKRLEVGYRGGLARYVNWIVDSRQGRTDISDLGVGSGCQGPFQIAGDGSDDWQMCAGGLEVQILNMKAGGTRHIRVTSP